MPRRSRRLTVDEAILAILIAAMDANQNISAAEAERAHHIIWFMRRFRGRSADAVNMLISRVRERINEDGAPAVLDEAAPVLPARFRPSAFATAVDLMLADKRLERAERAFVRDLAKRLKIRPQLAQTIVRVMQIKNAG